MGDLTAIRNALYLFHMPSAVRQARAAPLPAGMTLLLEIAAGEDATTLDTAEALNRPDDVLRQAAAFFIEQILLAPEADSYRVLGCTRTTGSNEMRRNMALLLRWAHPDADRAGAARTAFANRFTKAWENFKTPERRESYDAAHPVREPRPAQQPARQNGNTLSSASVLATRPVRSAHTAPQSPTPATASPGFLRRTFGRLFGKPR